MTHAATLFPALARRLGRAQRVLIASDFDGTLCPLAASPDKVRTSAGMLSLLQGITSHPRLRLALISGRELRDLRSHVALPDAIFSGNHGLQIRGGGIAFEHDAARLLRPELRLCCEDLKPIIEVFRGTWIEDKGLSATIHYRALAPSQEHAFRCAVRRHLVGRSPWIGLRSASKALELFPKIEWGKGQALQHIENQCGPFDLRIALGDDRTDEDMFLADETQINIKVGPNRPTKASYWLADSVEVGAFLERVLAAFPAQAGAPTTLRTGAAAAV